MLDLTSVLYSFRARRRNSSGATLSFMITASHAQSIIGRCTDALQEACALMRREWRKRSPRQAACSCLLPVHARYH